MSTTLRANLCEAYNRKAHERDGSDTQSWKVVERQHFVEMLQRERKQHLLELGAGPGKDGVFFLEQGLDVVCIDLSPEMVRLCRQKGLTAHVMDFGALDFAASSFDAVYALNCLLHLPPPELPGVLASIQRVLKPGGLFYLGVYGGYDYTGIWEGDSYEPKRFFSFHTDEHMQHVVGEHFDLLSFKRIALDEGDARMHFQSLVLRNRPAKGI